MTKAEFRGLFLRALNIAADKAEAALGEPIPRSFLVELHAPACSGETMSVDEALGQIYLGNDRFYRIIDIAILTVLPGESVALTRVSGHAPGRFEQTFDPANLGPFKQMVAEHVADRRVHSD